MDEPNRVALVTGGGRGIGRGIVEHLAAAGFAIAVNYRADAAAAALACEAALRLGAPAAEPIGADLADPAQGRRLVADAIGRFGRLDLLVSNAGIAPPTRLDLLDLTEASWDAVIGTNLRGPFFLAQAAARSMVEAAQTPPGTMIFVGSVSATLASVNRGEYCVSKAGLGMVARLFAARLAGSGILVYEVRPGIIATDMTAGVKAAYDRRIADGLVPQGRWGTPDDVGRVVAALAGGNFGFSTGAVIDVDGGLGLPRL